ncbi:MAG: TatD family hydrolase, partial [Bacteroidales bacterium]|nr:TatD family hydrolase [Bacteroidales bacterium]
MELFDTHSHIYMPEFDDDREEVVKRAQAAGVADIILPNVDMQTPPLIQALCDRYPDLCHPAMALHPTEVGPQYVEAVKQVERLLETNRYVAVGECGMDLYWDRTFRREQQWVLEQHLRWARDFRLPAIIHCREAFDDTIQLVEAAQDGSLTGVFHCFSGTADQARRVTDAGFAIGIGGVITYKKSDL